MKKSIKKLFASLLALALVVTGLFVAPVTADAAEDEFLVFVALGADATESGDWGYQYFGPDATNNMGDIEAVTQTVKNGETATVSVTLPTEALYTWFVSPAIYTNGATVGANSTFETTVKIDGVDVTDTVDFAAGDAFWTEETGAYAKEDCVRLAGGFNEWGTRYIAESPTGYTTIEYTVTLNIDSAAAVASVESTNEYSAFIALGADAVESNDWGLQYFGPTATTNMGDIVAVNADVVKNNEPFTVSLTLPSAALYTWFVSPVIDSKGDVFAADSTFETTVKIDGVEVATDLAAGDAFWYEETGAVSKDAAVRLAGGYNEWGTKYIAESPAGFTTIEFTITPHIMIAGDAAAVETAGSEVDLNGVYHAYLGLQTPVYSFRNSFEDEMYGKETEFFNQITGWDSNNEPVSKGGVFTDVEIAGNGTYSVSVTDFDLTGDFDSQEFFNLLFVSTDIPFSEDIKITDVNVVMDGKTVYTFDEGFQDPDTVDYIKVLAANLWNADLANGELFYYAIPTTSIELQFTVSGFAYDNAAAVVEEEVVEETAEPVVEEAVVEEAETNTGLIVGIVVAAVVVCGGVAAVVISKKKKAK